MCTRYLSELLMRQRTEVPQSEVFLTPIWGDPLGGIQRTCGSRPPGLKRALKAMQMQDLRKKNEEGNFCPLLISISLPHRDDMSKDKSGWKAQRCFISSTIPSLSSSHILALARKGLEKGGPAKAQAEHMAHHNIIKQFPQFLSLRST